LQVSTHDKNPLEELVFGSVSMHVAKHCKQPTLLLHGDRLAPLA
jgi:nucleotide-binding universal stress UspA family protein